MLFLACDKEDMYVPCDCTVDIIKEKNSGPLNGGAPDTMCDDPETLSDWTIRFPIEGSGGEELIVKNTQALRTMAYTGSIGDLRNQLGCDYNVSSVNVLKTGHKSDINLIGFASQLQVEEYIFAMYHPVNFPDHFIVYNTLTKEWWRYDHSDEATYLKGQGD